MSESYLIESSLMRSIVEKELPKGLMSNEDISQMTEEEKKELFQKQKSIIQEFQKRSEQEIGACTSILRDLNENLLSLRKNQMKNNMSRNQSTDQQNESQTREKVQEHRLENMRPPKTVRNRALLQKQHSLSIPAQKRLVKNYKPPFRH